MLFDPQHIKSSTSLNMIQDSTNIPQHYSLFNIPQLPQSLNTLNITALRTAASASTRRSKAAAEEDPTKEEGRGRKAKAGGDRPLLPPLQVKQEESLRRGRKRREGRKRGEEGKKKKGEEGKKRRKGKRKKGGEVVAPPWNRPHQHRSEQGRRDQEEASVADS